MVTGMCMKVTIRRKTSEKPSHSSQKQDCFKDAKSHKLTSNREQTRKYTRVVGSDRHHVEENEGKSRRTSPADDVRSANTVEWQT
jgi:hypothetical protein